MKHPPLTPAEARIFEITVAIYWEWAQEPRGRERTGAQAAIGSVWHRLGWTMRCLDAVERLSRQQR